MTKVEWIESANRGNPQAVRFAEQTKRNALACIAWARTLPTAKPEAVAMLDACEAYVNSNTLVISGWMTEDITDWKMADVQTLWIECGRPMARRAA